MKSWEDSTNRTASRPSRITNSACAFTASISCCTIERSCTITIFRTLSSKSSDDTTGIPGQCCSSSTAEGRRSSAPSSPTRRARLLLGLSGVFCILGLGSPAFFPFALLLLGAAGWMQRSLLQGFYRHGGLLFSGKAWLAYSLFSMAVATGFAAGLWRLAPHKTFFSA